MHERQTGSSYIDYLLALRHKEITVSNLGATNYAHPESSISCSPAESDEHVSGYGPSGFSAYKAMQKALSRVSETTSGMISDSD